MQYRQLGRTDLRVSTISLIPFYYETSRIDVRLVVEGEIASDLLIEKVATCAIYCSGRL